MRLEVKCNKIDAVDKITSKSAKANTNSVFRGKKRNNTVLPNKFRGFKLRTNVRLMF